MRERENWREGKEVGEKREKGWRTRENVRGRDWGRET